MRQATNGSNESTAAGKDAGAADRAAGPAQAAAAAGRIRVATPDDAAALQAIYAPNVRDPAISMETVVPDVATMRQRIERMLAKFPCLVAERDGRIAGYVHASPHRERPAWRWCCETTVYVDPDFGGRGVGTRLYAALFALLRLQNYLHAYAFIMLPNPASVRLHERCGYVQRAHLPRAGHKQGRWYDVGIWELALAALPGAPPEPVAFADLPGAAVRLALR